MYRKVERYKTRMGKNVSMWAQRDTFYPSRLVD